MGGGFHRLALAAAAVLFCLAGWVSVAGAEPAGLELSWEAPDGCPDAAAVRAWVAELVGGARPSGRVAVQAVLRRDGDGFVLQLAMRQDDSRRVRELRDDSCEELARAGSLVMAIALAPGALDREAVARFPDVEETSHLTATSSASAVSTGPVSPSPPPAPSGRVAHEPRSPADTGPSVGAPARRSQRAFLQLGALGSLGALPGFSPGMGLGVGLRMGADRNTQLSAEAGAFAERSTEVPGSGNLGGDFRLLTFSALLCRQLLTAPVASSYLLACIALELNRMSGTGYGGDWAEQGVGWWLAPGAAVEMGLASEEIQLGLRLGGSLSVRPPRFYLENVKPEVHAPGRVVGSSALVARWLFW